MQLNWMYTTLLSITLFAIQAGAQYTTSISTTDYPPTPPTSYYDTSTPVYPPGCTPRTITLTSATTYTSLTTITTTLTAISDGVYGYDNTYMTPMKKKTGLIIGLVIGLCGLAILLLIAFLLFRRSKKPKVVKYGESTPATGY